MDKVPRLPRYNAPPIASAALLDTIELHPSPACQLSCAYCHSINPIEGETIYGTRPLVPFSEYETSLPRLRKNGVKNCVISGGGEPLLYHRFENLLDLSLRTFEQVHLYSNGLSPLIRVGVLDGLMSQLESIRLSLHDTTLANPKLRSAFSNALTTLRKGARSPRVVAVSLLLSTVTDVSAAAHILNSHSDDIDTIEIKYLLRAAPSVTTRNEQMFMAMLAREIRARIIWRTEAFDVPQIPVTCWAFLRSLVIDPYGNVRVCCVRAHLPEVDAACLGHLSEADTVLWRERALDRQAEFGAGKCLQCSDRDRIFSASIQFNRRANLEVTANE